MPTDKVTKILLATIAFALLLWGLKAQLESPPALGDAGGSFEDGAYPYRPPTREDVKRAIERTEQQGRRGPLPIPEEIQRANEYAEQLRQIK